MRSGYRLKPIGEDLRVRAQNIFKSYRIWDEV